MIYLQPFLNLAMSKAPPHGLRELEWTGPGLGYLGTVRVQPSYQPRRGPVLRLSRVPTCGSAHLQGEKKSLPENPRDPEKVQAQQTPARVGPRAPAQGKLILQCQLPLPLCQVPGGRGF